MDNNFILSCESTIDLPYDYAKSRQIEVLFYNMLIDNIEYEDNMERDKAFDNNFYYKLKSNSQIQTSQINQYKYEEYFKKLINKYNKNIIHICFGTGMTQSYDNAIKASQNINSKLSDHKIYVIDSTCSSGGYGLLVDMIADKIDNGSKLNDLIEWIKQNKFKIQHHFYSTDLNYFKKSGRLSGPSATIVNVLNIVPIMKLNKDGKMIAYSKVRGTKKAVSKIINIMKDNALNGLNYNKKCFINHCYRLNEAKILAEKIKDTFVDISEIKINNIGNIIASHCGPGTISVYFFGNNRI